MDYCRNIFNSFIDFLKKNYLLALGIIIIGAYSISPQIIFQKKLGQDYQGIYFSFSDYELFWMARVQEIEDGYGSMGNTALHEYKDAPYLFPPLGEMIMAGFGTLFNLDTYEIMIYETKLFFPILLFLGIYFFVYYLQKDKKIAFLVSLAIFLASNLVKLNLSDIYSPVEAGLSIYLRPVNPQISSLFFYLFLGFFYLALEKGKRYFWLLAALFLGLSFNIYFYTWAFIITFLAWLAIFFGFRKQFRQLKIIVKVSLGGLIISIPYWYKFFQAYASSDFDFALNNMGIFRNHTPVLGALAVLIIVIYWATAKFLKLPKDLKHYFLLALTLTGIVVINQQVITGVETFQGHFHWYYNRPIFILIFIVCLDLLIKKYFFKFRNTAFFLLAMIIIYNGAITWQIGFDMHYNHFAGFQKYGKVVNWIKENQLKDKVILSDDLALNSVIPAYTSSDVYWSDDALVYFVPRERAEHNYRVYLWLLGVTPARIENYLASQKREISIRGGLDIANKHSVCTDCISAKEIQYLSEKYKEFYQSDFLKELKKYQADYLISASSRFNDYKFFKQIDKAGEFYIYIIL